MSAAPLFVLGAGVALLLALLTVWRCYAASFAATALVLAAALASVVPALRAAMPVMPGLFTFDGTALGGIGLVIGAALLILLLAYPYWRGGQGRQPEVFCLLLLLATLGAAALAACGSFISLFLGLETMTLAMIGMIAFARERPQAEEAALKYLILSGLSSAFLLLGMGLVALASGSLALQQPNGAGPLFTAGVAMLLIAAGFKLSVVPFHIWVPDIYAGAPAPAGAYVAVVPKIAVLAVIIRLVGAADTAMAPGVAEAMTLCAVFSMLIGNLLALLQDNIKRILGYSSIAHLGYLLVAILAAGAIGQVAVLFYLVTYALTMIVAFGVVAVLSDAEQPGDADRLAALAGLFWTRPVLAAIMTLALLSLAGLPPAIGFIAKMYIMAAGIHTALWWLIGTMVVSSVIGLFYYLNIIIVMAQRPGGTETSPAPVPGRWVLAAASLPLLGFGIAPQPLITLLRLVFGH
jgi:NADH-quinone oxidoreductase subunit N